MGTIEVMVIGISLVWVWQEAMFIAKQDNNILWTALGFKPFSCAFCVSFWVSVFLSIWFNDGIYLTLPIQFRIINVILNRI